MFFRKKKENKVTKDQIRVVEEIQYIDTVISKMMEDRHNLEHLGWVRGFQYDYGRFYLEDEYKELLKSFTKEQIHKLHEKKMKLIKGDEE